MTTKPARIPRPLHSTRDKSVLLYRGDCRRVMPRLEAAGVKARLLFADPPFNIKRQYDLWDDDLPWQEYVAFTREWVDAAVRLLTDNGSIVVNVYDNIAAEVVVQLKSLGLSMARWIIWHYRFGQNQEGNFIQSKQHVLYFTRDRKNFVRRMDRVLEPSDRASKYADPRTLNKKSGKAGMRCPLDVWQGEGFCRIQGNNRERRRKHDNQLPERYLRRVVLALSDPGDLVIDPFLGSGTTGVIAHAEGRQFIGVEYSPRNLRSAFTRIKRGPVTPGDFR